MQGPTARLAFVLVAIVALAMVMRCSEREASSPGPLRVAAISAADALARAQTFPGMCQLELRWTGPQLKAPPRVRICSFARQPAAALFDAVGAAPPIGAWTWATRDATIAELGAAIAGSPGLLDRPREPVAEIVVATTWPGEEEAAVLALGPEDLPALHAVLRQALAPDDGIGREIVGRLELLYQGGAPPTLK
ncbi:MAG TPA: hypothetical protein VHF22_09615 [Planctomycetota bacterium]|nr:hypothetical protein [Planctomycetota bacterium]